MAQAIGPGATRRKRATTGQLRHLRRQQDRTLLELVLREGRNRQIRRTATLLGHPVLDLLRLAVGPVRLGDLAPGAWRPLSPQEETALRPLLAAAAGPRLAKDP